jgi:flagellar biosynthetic protein FliS
MLPDTLAQARRDYLENQALLTSPTEIVQMLYQVAIDNLRAALDFLKSGDTLARARVVTKSEEAVDELLLALDHSVGAQFTHTLADLYGYILGQIIIGHARQSEQAFRDALTILESLADTWSQVRAKLHAEAAASEIELAKEAEAAATAPEADLEVNRDARESYSAFSSGAGHNAGGPAASGRDWSA